MERHDLTTKKCVPCEGGTKPFNRKETTEYLIQTPEWILSDDGTTIARTLKLKDFSEAIEHVMKIAEIAEKENHHPDIFIHRYKHLTISLSTHAIGGLSENDFIVAAKIDAIA